MARIGIMCDDYKVEMFKEELTKANIIFNIEGSTRGFTTITCISEQHLVKPIVDKVTQYFIDKYKKQN